MNPEKRLFELSFYMNDRGNIILLIFNYFLKLPIDKSQKIDYYHL